MRPETQLNSVVLPAPFGPISPVMRAGLHRQVDAAQRVDAVEAAGEVANLEQAHQRSCPPAFGQAHGNVINL